MVIDRPRREAYLLLSSGRRGQCGSSCGGGLINGGLWWLKEASGAGCFMSVQLLWLLLPCQRPCLGGLCGGEDDSDEDGGDKRR